MIKFTTATNLSTVVKRAIKEQAKERDKELGKAFRETGHKTTRLISRYASTRFKRFPPILKKGFFWRHKWKPSHSLRLAMTKQAAFLMFAHMYPEGYTRSRKDHGYMFIFPNDPRLTKRLRERGNEHFKAAGEKGAAGLISIPYGENRYYIINIEKHVGRTRRSKARGTTKKTGLIGWAHPQHRYKFRFSFSAIVRTKGGQYLNDALADAGFL